jgi:2,3-bisphosphoglycerate-independent phosphoglycerate mutase
LASDLLNSALSPILPKEFRMETTRKPTVLTILDGWGHREACEANAIALADTPVWDRLWREAPHGLISGSGHDVGLPEGQMGNSEVGHMNLGAGRVLHQDLTRIDLAIEQGTFADNPVLAAAIAQAVQGDRALHVLGLLSPGGVHSHEDQIAALLEAAAQRGVQRLYLHAFLDGRDTPPRSAAPSLRRMENLLAGFQGADCRIASVIGRYYAMDRDQRWERVEQAYALIVDGQGRHQAASATAALEAAYARGEDDEFVTATRVSDADHPPVTMQDGDLVIFMNFRADRARQISYALIRDDFSGFVRARRPKLGAFVTLTRYAEDLAAQVAYLPDRPVNVLGEYLSSLGKTQLRIAETEKYAHVTFFFSGGREVPFAGEERILIPSPKVATYDLQPQMSAEAVTDQMVAAIGSGRFDLIVCNYANGDMVGHTGKLEAAILAVQTLDHCLGRLIEAIEASGGEMLITADHGNVEQMVDYENDQPHTAHTCEFVPFVYVGARKAVIRSGGVLSDVAPTLLNLMDVPVPPEMTGKNLVQAV